MSKLVIVESPAKAKTISQFLGTGYEVLASYGHVRDLPERADDIPEEYKKLKWAKLGVNTDNDFEPLYIVPDDKKRQVDSLKKASRGATELLLATDEDREGESISWHILQLLKPKKGVPVRRIVFHEITPEAIQNALKNARDVDEDVVRAQETRRILDRLYGYSLSPVLWKKVAPKLSAGRVQSVAVRLLVERERDRSKFVVSEYWDLKADLAAKGGPFEARLAEVDGQKLATGKHFDPVTGEMKDKKVLRLLGPDANDLVKAGKVAKPWKVAAVDQTPGEEKPPVPFMTSTLQQEANRKLRFTSKRTMQIAQSLYEGVDLGKAERVGLITYMRTDSLHLAERALQEARDVIEDLYGKEYLPAKAVHYKTKAKGAQEAHEAIRPTDLSRRPQDVQKYLDADQLALYTLIWKRTVACQMLPAKVRRTAVTVSVEASGRNLAFTATGKTIVFPGFLRAYVEGSDDPDTELDSQERILPDTKVGDTLDLKDLSAESHFTRPPARYTEASLVKKLEDEGIGRPSTYASIISTIQDRGYVRKKVNELIPTFTAFAVTELLEEHFAELVDLKFTAKMENELDQIAEGKLDWVKHLRKFYHGEGVHPGLIQQISEREGEITYPALKLGSTEEGQPVVVRVGRYGTFVQRGEGGPGNTSNVPDDIAPADLTLESALQLIDKKSSGPQSIGTEPSSGRQVFYRSGRFGSYLELEQTPGEQESGEKPRRVSLPEGLKGGEIGEEEIAILFRYPYVLGKHPETSSEITVAIGRYGAYIKAGEDSRNLPDWRSAAHLTLDEAVETLAQPKVGRGARTARAATPQAALKEFGQVDGAEGPMRVLSGRYGPYVTDGKTNATIPKGIEPTEITVDQALELIKARAGAPKVKKRGGFRKKTTKRTSKSA
ncbi:MAG: type I DNA topoisomerase [Armatimonadetes bacterium]|nr:type I DNA topoisomerase [Armatimonadota bacterium]